MSMVEERVHLGTFSSITRFTILDLLLHFFLQYILQRFCFISGNISMVGGERVEFG